MASRLPRETKKRGLASSFDPGQRFALELVGRRAAAMRSVFLLEEKV
eukprot:COSAG06_NODE_62569_length_264_cov_1.569697_1_plen_46_part_01